MELQHLFVPRCYHPKDFGTVAKAEPHVFSDTSEDAIGAAFNMFASSRKRTMSPHLSNMAKPESPQLIRQASLDYTELHAAVLTVQAAHRVLKAIDMEITITLRTTPTHR